MSLSPFSDAALSKVVSETMASADIPAGHRNAVVLSTDGTGLELVVSAKLGTGDHWVVSGVVDHSFTGDTKVGAKLVGSW